MIYESGSPLFKVEAGTTLEVMKLLYEAEFQTTSENVIGVRPRNSHDLPCIVTLQDTKLDQLSYDLIVKGKWPHYTVMVHPARKLPLKFRKCS